MKRAFWVLAAACAIATPAAAQGGRQVTECQPKSTGGQPTEPGRAPVERAGEYDVVLDVPDLCVRRIKLDVQNLQAKVALNARVANLVRVDAGANVEIGRVNLLIQGVRAQALLLVDLDNVVYIIDRTLSFIDENPELVTGLFRTTQGALSQVGGVADQALQPGGVVSNAVGTLGRTLDDVTAPNGVLSKTVNQLGQTVQRTVSTSGSLVERTLDTAGNVVKSRTLGSLSSLPLVRETKNAAGQTVRRVRDETGAVIEYVAGQGGRISDVRVVSGGGN